LAAAAVVLVAVGLAPVARLAGVVVLLAGVVGIAAVLVVMVLVVVLEAQVHHRAPHERSHRPARLPLCPLLHRYPGATARSSNPVSRCRRVPPPPTQVLLVGRDLP